MAFLNQTKLVLLYKYGKENERNPIFHGIAFDEKENAFIFQSALEYLRDN